MPVIAERQPSWLRPRQRVQLAEVLDPLGVVQPIQPQPLRHTLMAKAQGQLWKVRRSNGVGELCAQLVQRLFGPVSFGDEHAPNVLQRSAVASPDPKRGLSA